MLLEVRNKHICIWPYVIACVLTAGGLNVAQDPVNGVTRAEQNIEDGSISFPNRCHISFVSVISAI
jgi:hypothetical protein